MPSPSRIVPSAEELATVRRVSNFVVSLRDSYDEDLPTADQLPDTFSAEDKKEIIKGLTMVKDFPQTRPAFETFCEARHLDDLAFRAAFDVLNDAITTIFNKINGLSEDYMVPAENATVDAHDPSTGPLLALGTDSPEPSHAAYSVLQTKYPKGHTETQVPGAQSPVKRLVLQSEQDPRSLGSAPAAHQNHFLKFFKAPAANRPYVSPYSAIQQVLPGRAVATQTISILQTSERHSQTPRPTLHSSPSIMSDERQLDGQDSRQISTARTYIVDPPSVGEQHENGHARSLDTKRKAPGPAQRGDPKRQKTTTSKGSSPEDYIDKAGSMEMDSDEVSSVATTETKNKTPGRKSVRKAVLAPASSRSTRSSTRLSLENLSGPPSLASMNTQTEVHAASVEIHSGAILDSIEVSAVLGQRDANLGDADFQTPRHLSISASPAPSNHFEPSLDNRESPATSINTTSTSSGRSIDSSKEISIKAVLGSQNTEIQAARLQGLGSQGAGQREDNTDTSIGGSREPEFGHDKHKYLRAEKAVLANDAGLIVVEEQVRDGEDEEAGRSTVGNELQHLTPQEDNGALEINGMLPNDSWRDKQNKLVTSTSDEERGSSMAVGEETPTNDRVSMTEEVRGDDQNESGVPSDDVSDGSEYEDADQADLYSEGSSNTGPPPSPVLLVGRTRSMQRKAVGTLGDTPATRSSNKGGKVAPLQSQSTRKRKPRQKTPKLAAWNSSGTLLQQKQACKVHLRATTTLAQREARLLDIADAKQDLEIERGYIKAEESARRAERLRQIPDQIRELTLELEDLRRMVDGGGDGDGDKGGHGDGDEDTGLEVAASGNAGMMGDTGR